MEAINRLIQDLITVNWAGIVIPISLSVVAWFVGRSWTFFKSIGNKDLRGYIGEYFGYHGSPMIPNKIIESKIRIYKNIIGFTKINILYPGFKPYKGDGFVIGSTVYFKVKDPDNRYEELMVLRNPISTSVDIAVGTYAGISTVHDPIAGVQVLSKSKLSIGEQKKLLGAKPTLVTKLNKEQLELLSIKTQNDSAEQRH